MSETPQTHERVVKLETYRETDNIAIQALTSKVDATHVLLIEVKEQLSKQKGFISGAMFVILPLWSMFTIFVQSWWTKDGGAGQ